MENRVKRIVEVESISVETKAPRELFSKLSLELEKLGFEDIHKKALESTCRNLKDILNVDLISRVSFKKKVNTPRPHVFIDTKTKNVIMFSEPEEEEIITANTAFEITCFSEKQKGVGDLVETAKKLLEHCGLGKDAVHDGDFDENCNKRFIRSILQTRRSTLIENVNSDITDVFKQPLQKKLLRRLTTFPMKFFRDDHFLIVEEYESAEPDPYVLVSCGILEEKFSLECGGENCVTVSDRAPLFDLKKEASSALERKVLVCPSCGGKLTSENASVRSYFRFTDLGLECAKGLWLEAHVKLALEELGVKGDIIKCCAIHGKDELDLVFTYFGDLYVCECRDRVVGRNDVYVLAMKTSRINEDKETDAIVNKVLMVSTEPVSKDIVSTSPKKEDEEPEYIFISGNSEAIEKELVKVIRKSKRRHKREKMKLLSEYVLDCLPPTEEEIEKRFFEKAEIS